MKKEYQIIHMSAELDDDYGNVCIALANPVQSNALGMKFVTQNLCSETEKFLFPNEPDFVDPLLDIARGQGIWHPDEDDFEDKMKYNPETGKDENVHCHCSLWNAHYEPTLNSGYEPELIPNKAYKTRQLKDQYYRNGWYESMGLREYVESLAEGDDVQNFFGWLFDKPELNGCSPRELPTDFEMSYESFLDLFEEDF